MGRPLNKRFFGELSDAGLQIEVTVKNNVKTHILEQKGVNRYRVNDDGSGNQGLIKLVNEQNPDAVGEGSLTILLGNPGTEVVATAVMTIKIANLTGSGSGYTALDVLTVSGGTFTQAALITVDSVTTGAIATFTVTNTGLYSVLPSSPLTVTGGTGTGATFSATWEVQSVNIAVAGSGFTTVPLVEFTGGGVVTSAAATAVVSGDSITPINVTVNGEYTGVPTINVERPLSEGTVELVEKLQSHLVSTFDGNRYLWEIAPGSSGLIKAGNISGA